MASTVDTGDIKLRTYETRRLTALDPNHRRVRRRPGSRAGQRPPPTSCWRAAPWTAQSARRHVHGQRRLVLYDQGRVQRYTAGRCAGPGQPVVPRPVRRPHPCTATIGAPAGAGEHLFRHLHPADVRLHRHRVRLAGPGAAAAGATSRPTPGTAAPRSSSFPTGSKTRGTCMGKSCQFEVAPADDVTVYLNGAKLITTSTTSSSPTSSSALGEPACDNSRPGSARRQADRGQLRGHRRRWSAPTTGCSTA